MADLTLANILAQMSSDYTTGDVVNRLAPPDPLSDPKGSLSHYLMRKQGKQPSPELANVLAQETPKQEPNRLGSVPHHPHQERGFLLPIMKQGGELSPAVPGVVYDAYQSLARLMSREHGYRPGSGEDQPIRDAASVASSVAMPGLLGLYGVPAGALAANGARRFTLDYFGSPVQMLENPTERALQAFLGRTKYKAARRIVDDATGDVYVWDAADPALHEMVARTLGIAKHRSDTIGLD